MVRERGTTHSNNSGDDCSSSSSSEETSTSSSSPSSFSSGSSSSSSSSSSSRAGARPSSCKPSRKRLKSRHSSNREFAKKRSRQGYTSCDRGKKRRKIYSDVESNGKVDKKKGKRRSKKSKSDVEMESATRVSASKEKKFHKLHDSQDDTKSKKRNYNLLEEAMNVQEQQKALIRQNAEIAKARLESGELQRARDEQKKMHQLYGTVDWRANKKLRTEKKMLERTVAAGKRLASLEQREYARMDAFRVALGLPTAEAQRQAEWRREATQALLELENGSKPAGPALNHSSKKPKHGVIGPMRPP